MEGEEGGGVRLSKRFNDDKGGGEVDYKTKSGTAWSHNFLNQKPWHPLSYPNQRCKWIAEQTHAQRERKTEEVAREYAQEQEFYRQTTLISKKDKEKVELMQAVSFMYVRPPGYNPESAKAAELNDEKKKEDMVNKEPTQTNPDGPSSSLPPQGEKKKPRPKDVFGRALPTEEEFEVLKNAPSVQWRKHIAELVGTVTPSACQTCIFVTTLDICANLATVELGKQIHGQILELQLHSDVHIASTIVDMYSKCGNMQDSLVMFEKAPERDYVTWSAMICAYAYHGLREDAIKLFEEMQILNVKPNHTIFISVLRACAHMGYVDKGLHYFRKMRSHYGLDPQMEHYSCMVDLLGRSGQVNEALKLIESMPFKADNVIWRTLLGIYLQVAKEC
ncbi:pentatricopeptide repeat-containing protein, mitochondrial [Trifolium repens]|nr:pentatricopeptide repeat-containing protein, mitochondrial [Trifolium repens]